MKDETLMELMSIYACSKFLNDDADDSKEDDIGIIKPPFIFDIDPPISLPIQIDNPGDPLEKRKKNPVVIVDFPRNSRPISSEADGRTDISDG